MTIGVRRRAVELSSPAGSVATAEWRFPEEPLILVQVDGRPAAVVDYVHASASARWSLKWLEHPGFQQRGEFALLGLAGQVPEDADTDESLRLAALDIALDAVATHLGGRSFG